MHIDWEIGHDPLISCSSPRALARVRETPWPRTVAAVILNGVHPFELGVACEVFGLEPESLQSNRKGKAVSRPRALAMYLARKLTRAPLSEIGAYFGRKSHSTVISASKKIEGWMAKQAPLQVANGAASLEETIRRVEERLRAG